jgi:hypothetical protein
MQLEVHRYSSVFDLTNHTFEKIYSFSSFPNGWHHGLGKAFSDDVISAAIELISSALSSNSSAITDAFPGTYGEIMVCLYKGEKTYEFTVNRLLSVEYACDVGKRAVEGPTVLELPAALTKISELASRQWRRSFTSYRHINLTPSEDILPASPLSRTKTEMYRAFPRIASRGKAKMPAISFDNITPTFSRNYLFSSGLNQSSYQLDYTSNIPLRG